MDSYAGKIVISKYLIQHGGNEFTGRYENTEDVQSDMLNVYKQRVCHFS